MLTQKIHKKFRFQPNAKIFAIFFLIQYRDFTKWKTIFGVIGTLNINGHDLTFDLLLTLALFPIENGQAVIMLSMEKKPS